MKFTAMTDSFDPEQRDFVELIRNAEVLKEVERKVGTGILKLPSQPKLISSVHCAENLTYN
jgi:hypothetical protein